MTGEVPEVDTLPEGTVLDGKFRIVKNIGIGGMGAVYEIRHELTKHRRALKLLHRQLTGERQAVDRFLQEASAAGRIENDHIAETFDAGWLSTGEPYLVMEYLEGRALDAWLADGGALDAEEALRVVAQACRGAHAAHQAGIVHRDLKPENLFVVDRDGEPFVKILDFGIGKFEDARAVSRATQEGAFMGTPFYMSPEQFLDGRAVDARSDVYSLGVILFECITGAHPYPCETLAHLATKIMAEEPPPPSSLRPGLPAGIDVILSRALAKRPEERFATAEAMAEAIERLGQQSNLTLPQGSAWRSQYPPPVEVREARVRTAGAEKTVRVVGEETPLPSVADRERKRPLLWGAIAVAAVALALVLRAALTAAPEESPGALGSSSAVEVASARAPALASAARVPSAAPSSTASAAVSAAARTGAPPRPSAKPYYATPEEFPE
jgi:serine/threonine-protein kinase